MLMYLHRIYKKLIILSLFNIDNFNEFDMSFKNIYR